MAHGVTATATDTDHFYNCVLLHTIDKFKHIPTP
jgi:hypothetical protein